MWEEFRARIRGKAKLSILECLDASTLESFFMRHFMHSVCYFSFHLKFTFKTYNAGAVHEHSRHDRDLFVFILHSNIQPNAVHNFRKVTNETYSTRNTPFDPSSLMMYGPKDFGIMDSNGRRTTIEAVKPGVEIR